jgi:cyclophilin family peptidyl-prolyl cis-trans isomerase
MADHKAPTEVTVVAHEEQSAFAAFVQQNWMKAAVVALIATAYILFTQFQNQQAAEAVDDSWNKLTASVEEDQTGRLTGDPDDLGALAEELKGTMAGPWALFYQARSLASEQRYEDAIGVLTAIKADYPNHPLVKDSKTYGESVTPLTLIERLSKVYTSAGKWRAENPNLFANPEAAVGSPKARITTDHGDILVALDVARAPLHVANFTKMVEEGFYDGMKVHKSSFGQLMETGDPATKDADSEPITWGLKGAGEDVEMEETGLYHFAGVLSANQALGSEASSGSLISLTALPNHYLDDKNVVFGHVIEGLDVVKEISGLPADSTGQRPETPATIQSITILPGA